MPLRLRRGISVYLEVRDLLFEYPLDGINEIFSKGVGWGDKIKLTLRGKKKKTTTTFVNIIYAIY